MPMLIPIITKAELAKKIGYWFYVSMLTILPSIFLPIFGIFLYRQIIATRSLLQDNAVANETLKDAKVRARIILGISAVCVTSLLIYSSQLVSTAK